MRTDRYSEQIVCGYLHTITQNGYPPDIRQTAQHIREMADMGFRALELEGIDEQNITYLFTHREQLAAVLAEADCRVPILCLVLPGLAAADRSRQERALEFFEKGCEVARAIGAEAVLDNGPLLPVVKPANAPVKRHYGSEGSLIPGLQWESYSAQLVNTYRTACGIAATHGLHYQLHPCEGSLIKDTDSFLLFSRQVDHPALLFNFDTANQFYFHDHLSLGFLRAEKKINYIHLSDNGGQRVEHLLPGDGRINWPQFFETLAAAGYRGRFGIDVGGAESPIADITDAYIRCADWLQEQLDHYSSILQP